MWQSSISHQTIECAGSGRGKFFITLRMGTFPPTIWMRIPKGIEAKRESNEFLSILLQIQGNIRLACAKDATFLLTTWEHVLLWIKRCASLSTEKLNAKSNRANCWIFSISEKGDYCSYCSKILTITFGIWGYCYDYSFVSWTLKRKAKPTSLYSVPTYG